VSPFSFIQIGLNTVDLGATVRFYAEVFGFANAGGQVGWGDVMKVQGLDSDGQTLVWWLFGRHPRIQFEIFHHTGPDVRPKPEDWGPADHGWVRYGIAVSDFDGVCAKLDARGIASIAGQMETAGNRRIAIRDPWAGIIIEIWENGPGLEVDWPFEPNNADPLILYVTSSVSDLAAARDYYTRVLGFETAPLELLHAPEDEGMWGLGGASREGFLVKAGHGYLEIVEYASPRGRPRPADHRLSDQGIMNVGLATRDPGAVQAVLDRLDAEGKGPRWLTVGPDVLGCYINEPDREIELLACPEEVEAAFGFTFAGEFNGGDFIRMVERGV
jgi:catechol 2,3-dioxygenase-like lactoylglutathione lyase family enzyme